MSKTQLKSIIAKGGKVKIKGFDELWLIDRIVNSTYWAYNDDTLIFEGELTEIEEVHKSDGTIIPVSKKDYNYGGVDGGFDWEEELSNIYEMIQNFSTIADIARDYGVSKQRLSKILKKFGITTKSKAVYFREIAAAVGCSDITVRNHINGSNPTKKFGKEIDKYTLKGHSNAN